MKNKNYNNLSGFSMRTAASWLYARLIAAVFVAVSLLYSAHALPVAGSKVFTASVNIAEKTDSDYPVIFVTGLPVSQVLLNDINLNIFLSDDNGLKRAKLVVGLEGDTNRRIYSIDNLNGELSYLWRVTIPREVVGEEGFVFYLEAEDIDGQISYLGRDRSSSVTSLEFVQVFTTRSLVKPASAAGGLVVFEDSNALDGEISINFPVMALNRDEDVGVRILRNPEETSAYGINNRIEKYGMVYEISPVTRDLNNTAQLTLLYYDSELIRGQENNLRIFWWDGFEWRLTGGTVDPSNKTVSTSISRLGMYAVMPLASISASAYRPKERIITPNNDGINDYANFDGLANKSTEIKIFDVTGRRIRRIKSEPYRWDGRDDDGRRVENGVYIYQFKVDGELISGVIAVAK